MRNEPPEECSGSRCATDCRTVVFCDFDGTITAQDTLQAIVRQFLPADAMEVLAGISRGNISLRAGTERLIGSLPSKQADTVRRFVTRQPLRPGFRVFLQDMYERHIPVVVVSGNIQFCVESRLAPLRHLIHRIHALEVDLDRPRMRALIASGTTSEAVPKADIVLSYPAQRRIVIGDSLSDRSMALQADSVFARDRLLSFLQQRELPATPFNDFHDVLRQFPDSGLRAGK